VTCGMSLHPAGNIQFRVPHRPIDLQRTAFKCRFRAQGTEFSPRRPFNCWARLTIKVKDVPLLNYAPYHEGKCRSGGTVTPFLILELDGGEWSDVSPVPAYP